MSRARGYWKCRGIGPLSATALIASLGIAHHFPAGRNFAANLGLTPHEHSSGGKQRLFGISKRGDRYLRTLLIHGARSALRCAKDKPDRLLQWALKLKDAKGFNVAACALANKLARVAWAMLAHGRRYQAQWNPKPCRSDELDVPRRLNLISSKR